MKNILTEAAAVDEVLTVHRQEEIRKAQESLAQRVDRLTVLLYVVAAVTAIIELLDMEAVREVIKHHPIGPDKQTSWLGAWTLLLASLLGLALIRLYRILINAGE